MTDARPRLWTHDFSRLWVGEAVSFTGSQLTVFALPIVALQLLHADPASVTLINALAGMGTLLFAIVFAPWSDGARTRVMTAINMLRCVVLVGVSVLLLTGHLGLWALVLTAFLIAGLTAVYDSGFSAIRPTIVTRDALPRANSWIGGVRSVADIGAGGLAGAVLAVTSPVVLFATNAVTYLVAAISVGGVRSPEAVRSRAEATGLGTYVRSIGAGFRVLLADRLQLPLTLAVAHFNLFTTGIQAVYVSFAVRELGFSAGAVGALVSVGGVIGLVGVWLGPVALRRWRLPWLLGLTFAVPGLLCIALSIVGNAPVPLAAATLAGTLGGWAVSVLINITATESIKQVLVPNEVLGRFTAAQRVLTWGVDPVGALLGGGLLLVLPLPATLGLLGLGVVTSALWVPLSPDLRRLPLFDRLHIGTTAREAPLPR